MSNLVFTLKLIHLLGAAVLFGTGLGIAFFMWMAHRTGDPATIAATARTVVISDTIFTAAAAIVQPFSGAALAGVMGYSIAEPWIALSLALYVIVGLCWLPVLWIQLRLRDIASLAAQKGTELPTTYIQLFRVWVLLGWPAFAGVIAIFILMIWKPELW